MYLNRKLIKKVVIVLIFIVQSCLSNQKHDLSIYSQNSYAFPENLTNLLKLVTSIAHLKSPDINVIDLASGIKKSISERLKLQGEFVKNKNPDIANFQEVWNENNKKTLLNALQPNYPYIFFTVAKDASEQLGRLQEMLTQLEKKSAKAKSQEETKAVLNELLTSFKKLSLLDSGLLIASKYPFIWKTSITYSDKMEEELLAAKGALIVGIEKDGMKYIIVNTHLQSGTDNEAIRIKKEQVDELAEEINKAKLENPDFKNAKIIIAGDLNEPFLYVPSKNELVDRTFYLVKSLNADGVDVSNKQVEDILINENKIEQVLDVNEYNNEGFVKALDGQIKQTLKEGDPQVGRLVDNLGQEFFNRATDPTGKQGLDHFLIDPSFKIKKYDIFRQEVLGGSGALKGNNLPDQALSDHAGIMATLES